MTKQLSPEEQFQLDFIERYGVRDKDRELPGKPSPHKRRTKTDQKSRARTEWVHAEYEIDLHHLTVDESLGAVEMAMEMMEKAGMKTLRIVHGGGNPGYGPIKKALDRVIRSRWKHKVSGWILEKDNPGSSLLTLRS